MDDNSKSGFSVGDSFVYISKYGGVTFGVVDDIMLINSIETDLGVTVCRFTINKRYDSKEIHHYKDVMGKKKYTELYEGFKKMIES